MSEFISIFFLISLWASCTSSIFKYLNRILKNESNIKNYTCLSISLGFIFSFTSLSGINIFLHSLGITLSNNNLLIPITITLFYLNFIKIKEFCISIYSKIDKNHKNIFYNLDLFTSIFLIIIFIQIFCLTLRFLLPVTHWDALGQYFYDSLQISRLDNLSISDIYKLGEYFRTDSLASFFDALIIQLTDNWFFVRSVRVIALILVITNSIELCSNIGSISFRKSILITAIVLSLPDVWSSCLSGKHDGYVFLFELIGIYSISLSIISKEKLVKIIFSLFAIFIAFNSVGIRLSSLSLFVLSIISFIYNSSLFPIKEYFREFWKLFLSIRLPILLILGFAVIGNLTICLFNYKYFSNPIYWLSPPYFLKSIFPNAMYKGDYEIYKEALSLRNIPLIIKPLITIFYSSFGIEPIRYGLNKLKELNNLIFIISSYLNYIGPKSILVSIHSFSPFIFLPYFGLKDLIDKRKKIILILMTLWILLWSISIPYTRVALASSMSIIVFGFSESFNFKIDFQKYRFLNYSKFIIISFGLFYTLLFSIWSFSNLFDLPLANLIKDKGYSRTNLTREYIKIHNKSSTEDLLPSKRFELDWKKIEETNKENLLFLKGAPYTYAYFMNRGLITYKKMKITNKVEDYAICFSINKNKRIIKNSCN